MKLIKGTAAINKAIDSIQTRGKKLDNDIWVAAVSVIAHVDEHGDVTVVNKLVDAMPKGSRVNALREFLNTFGKVAYSEDAKCFVYDREAKTDLTGAQETCWTEFKPEPPYVPVDLAAMLAKLVKKATAAAAEPHEGDKVDADLLAKLAALVPAE